MKVPLPVPGKWTRIPPWFIFGVVCILGLILLVLAVRNINHEQAFMTRTLLS